MYRLNAPRRISFQNRLNVPRRKEFRIEDHILPPTWKIYRDKGEVSEALAFYTPDDINEIDDRDTLKKLYLIYTFTDREPSPKDAFYMRTMSLTIMEKLSDIHTETFELRPFVIHGLKYRFDA